MTQEEKELLLKDLCMRLPYETMFHTEKYGEECLLSIDLEYEKVNELYGIQEIKPYLRPLSSMTEEEYTKYRTIQGRNCDYGEATICVSKSLYQGLLYDDNEPLKINVYYPNPVIQDWLLSHHFDYRGLIEKGLAIVAPEGMYNTKTEQQ